MIVSFYKCFFLKNKTTGNTSINTCAYMQVKFLVYLRFNALKLSGKGPYMRIKNT